MAEGPEGFLVALLVFLVISFIVTYFLKKYFKAQTTLHLISLIKTTRPLWLFDVFARHRRFWVLLANVGLILGFGAIAVDFLFARNKKTVHRAIIFVFSAAVLSSFFYFFDQVLLSSVFGGSFLQNFMTKQYAPIILVLFGVSGFSVFVLATLFFSAQEIVYRYLIGERACPGIAPLIPGVELPRVPFTPPLWVWVPMLLILVIHEGSHGVLGRIAKVKFKSTGLLLFGFLPIGAFVEPDEEDVEKKSKEEKLRFFAGGVSANLAAFALTILLVVGLSFGVNAFFGAWAKEIKYNSVDGVVISKVVEKVELCGSNFPSPAFGEIEEGSKVLQVNGKEIKTLQDFLVQLRSTQFKPTAFLLEKNGQEYEKVLLPNELGSFGIMVEETENKNYAVPENYKLYQSITGGFFAFMTWFLLLNFLVALVNFLPVPFFDGGRISQILLVPYLGFLNKSEKDTAKLISRFFTVITLILFVVNFLPMIF